MTEYIFEELSKDQKEEVDSWEKGKHTFSDHVFGGPIETHHTKVIPLVSHNSPEHAPTEISNHLLNHGYSVSDYRAGFATDKHGRDVKIGKVLEKTKAHPDIIKKFVNDKQREASTIHNDLQVVISRHPHQIAGMSTDRGWTSCMNMAGGENKHYLPRDVLHGTHVAYLTHKGDNEAKKPVARIALKPFEELKADDSDPTPKHTILRPERKDEYGHGGEAFAHTVRDFTEKNFKIKSPIYKKHPRVYDDSTLSFDDSTLSFDDNHDGTIVTHPNPKHEDLEKLLSSPKMEIGSFRNHVINAVGRIKNHDTLEKLADNPNPSIRASLVSNNTPPHILEKLSKDNDYDVRGRIANHENTPEHILHAMAHTPDDKADIHEMIANNTKNPEILEHLSKSIHNKVISAVVRNYDTPMQTLANISKHPETHAFSLDNMLSTKAKHAPDIVENIYKHKNRSGHALYKIAYETKVPHILHDIAVKHPEQHDTLILNAATPAHALDHIADHFMKDQDSNYPYIVRSLLRHPHTTSHIVDKFSNHSSSHVRGLVADSDKTSPHILSHLVDDTDEDVSRHALINHNIPTEDLIRHSVHPDMKVRRVVAYHIKTPSHILDKLANAPETAPYVAANTHTPPSILHRLGKSEDINKESQVISALLHNFSTSAETLHHLSNHAIQHVRASAIKHPNASTQTLEGSYNRHNNEYHTDYQKNFINKIIARHENAPTHILQKIAEGPHREARAYAKQALENRGQTNRFIEKT